jgi:hypothetical protein
MTSPLPWRTDDPPLSTWLLTEWLDREDGVSFYHLVYRANPATEGRNTSMSQWWPGDSIDAARYVLVRWVPLPSLDVSIGDNTCSPFS